MNSGAFLYTVTLALALGIGSALLFGLGVASAAPLLALSIIAAVFAFILRAPKVFLVSAALAACAFGILRVDVYQVSVAQENLAQFANEKVDLKGAVVSEPDVRDTSVRANVAVSAVNNTVAQGTALAVFPAHTTVSYGDIVEAKGMLTLPQSFVGDNGNEFDYPAYLRLQGVSAVVQDAALVSDHAEVWSLKGFLFFLKGSFNNSINRILGEPENALIEGILLGERHGLPQNLEQMLVAAGLIHIVILSGYSMSVVGESVLRGLKFLPKTPRFVIGAALLILFVMLTGAAATTVRACAMALVGLLARYFNRTSVALRSLALVAAAMVLYNPPILLNDSSFIVSVLATFGLITFSPWIAAHLPSTLSKFPDARSIVTSTLAVQLFALPALLYFTGTVSFFALPANLLVLPVLPFVMLAGFLTGLAGFISATLAFVPAVVTYIVLKFIILVVTVVNMIPFSATTVKAFPLWGAVACYAPLFGVAIFVYRRNASQQLPN